MVLSLILTVFSLLLCAIAFTAGFFFGHVKSSKKFVLNINLLDIEDDESGEPDGGEEIPLMDVMEKVTPILKKTGSKDAK